LGENSGLLRTPLTTQKKPAKHARRAAIYARVSTFDKGQNPETQLAQLRSYAKSRGLTLAHELVDYASGTNGDRPNYQRLFDLVRKREVDVVLVWHFDRFARSTQAPVNALVEFRDLGVDFISYQENIDTTTAQGKMVFAIMASLAEFESALISERRSQRQPSARSAPSRSAISPSPSAPSPHRSGCRWERSRTASGRGECPALCRAGTCVLREKRRQIAGAMYDPDDVHARLRCQVEDQVRFKSVHAHHAHACKCGMFEGSRGTASRQLCDQCTRRLDSIKKALRRR
jgi:predicted site-specific integrase-resolvase